MSKIKLSENCYLLACVECGSHDKLCLMPNRNGKDVVGVFVSCKKCFDVLVGRKVKIDFDILNNPPKSEGENENTSPNK